MPSVKNPVDPAGGTGDPTDPDPNNPDPNNPDPNKAKDPPADPLANFKPEDKDLIARLIDDKVKASIADIKGKLDGAYAARDETARKLAEIDAKKRADELKALEDSGKHKEAFDIKINEANTKYATLEAENKTLKDKITELTRDADLKDQLRELPKKFRSTKASDMAFKEISNQLVRNDKGEWVHRTGVSLEDFIEAFAKDEANDFLFVPEENTGLGNNRPGPSGDPANKSLFERSQAEVMRMAAEGRLPKRK